MDKAKSDCKRVFFELGSTSKAPEHSSEGHAFQESLVDPRLRNILKSKFGIQSVLHMQELLLRHVLHGSSSGRVGDVILCAPTGSGKTLAYALPVVQDMLDRRMPRLRAIVLVPTRDLASQVFTVFSTLTKQFGIKISCVVGASPIAAEAMMIPKAEILIATPGRLVDHVNNGTYLKLEDVRYLILDESDRLLEDSYQQWIDVIIPVLGKHNSAFKNENSERPVPVLASGIFNLAIRPDFSMKAESLFSGLSQVGVRKILVSATQTRNPMRLHNLDLRSVCFFEPMGSNHQQKQDSAGDTFVDRYTVPPKMTERGWIVDNIQQKPLALLQLLGWIPLELKSSNASKSALKDISISEGGTKLVFANSVDSAHRLCRLLELCAFSLGKNGTILEMSGTLSPARRKYVVQAVRQDPSLGTGKSTENASQKPRFVIVVCSDVLARGMDILTVDTVINYDAPAHVNNYLHRAGRTARAGRSGYVFTLLLANQVRHFRAMVYEAVREKDKKVKTVDLNTNKDTDSNHLNLMMQGLHSLRRVLRSEKCGTLNHDESLPAFMLYELCSNRTERSHALQRRRDVRPDPDADFHKNKRARTMNGHILDEHEERIDNAEVFEDTEAGIEAENTLTDILFVQIGQNLLSQT